MMGTPALPCSSASPLELRVAELEEASRVMRQDCEDYRCLAYEADLRLRSVVDSLGQEMRAEAAVTREAVRRVAEVAAEGRGAGQRAPRRGHGAADGDDERCVDGEGGGVGWEGHDGGAAQWKAVEARLR
jgi:hypothetical protein